MYQKNIPNWKNIELYAVLQDARLLQYVASKLYVIESTGFITSSSDIKKNLAVLHDSLDSTDQYPDSNSHFRRQRYIHLFVLKKTRKESSISVLLSVSLICCVITRQYSWSSCSYFVSSYSHIRKLFHVRIHFQSASSICYGKSDELSAEELQVRHSTKKTYINYLCEASRALATSISSYQRSLSEFETYSPSSRRVAVVLVHLSIFSRQCRIIWTVSSLICDADTDSKLDSRCYIRFVDNNIISRIWSRSLRYWCLLDSPLLNSFRED